MSEAQPPTTKVAVVTGGGSGIGLAISERLAADGVAIAVLDLDGGAADRAAKAITDGGGTAIGLAVDVTDRPGLEAAVADVAEPSWRGSALGVYRMWRDMGFAVGAIVVGVVADRAGMTAAIVGVGAITAVSGIVVALRMRETRPTIWSPASPR